MTARICLLLPAVTGLLTGCSSSTPVVHSTEPPPTVIVGSGSDADRTVIQKTDSQIYQAEHAADSDTPAVSAAPNQGVP